MSKCIRIVATAFIYALAITTLLTARPAMAASAAEIDREVDTALRQLYTSEPEAGALAAKAKAILVFPSVVKAGFLVGAQYDEGALRERGKTVGYYRMVAASYGLQAGVQSFGYAMLLMTDAAVSYRRESAGWEVGVGPSIVIVDKGKAKTLTTTTAQSDVYAFIFGQQGLMAGVGVQGSKITKITP